MIITYFRLKNGDCLKTLLIFFAGAVICVKIVIFLQFLGKNDNV
jgi:hypothetical protein